MGPQEITDRITTNSERAFTTTVNDIEHMESSSMNGVSVTKIFFQPGANIPAAVAQITASAQTTLRSLPSGITRRW
jgi:multidrug efflux pump subunit AcrB